MAVSNNYEIKNYILDGIATQFAIPFDVNVDDYGNAINIVVYLGLDELEKDVDYTISIKTINYPGAVDHAGEKLTVFRRTPIEQPVDFVDNGNFTLEDIETGLDRSIMIEQETSANLDNTVRAQESAEKAEQYKDIAIEKASDAEDWAVGTRSDGETPSHSLESSKHYAEAADTSASMATSMRNQSAANALISEGYAKGTQGGVPVESGDYYQDNSKYYKEQAGTSATSAGASATKASEWADKHEDSEVETGRYSAKHWAAKASTSAGGAAVSAYNAGQSETKAGKWAEEAEDVEVETGKYSAKHYAAKASASASNAYTSETNAGASASLASDWAEKATEVETGKYSAKYWAEQSATSAGLSEGSAEDSEAYAIGTRGGVPVTSGDPTYHNNSKYYSEEAGLSNNKPAIGVPTLWFSSLPDWAIDFGNGAATQYLWANYPNLDNDLFKGILTTLSTNGWMTAHDATGFYVPDLRGITPIGYGTNAKRTGETTAGGNLGVYTASQNKYHNHGWTGSSATSQGMSANASHGHNIRIATNNINGSNNVLRLYDNKDSAAIAPSMVNLANYGDYGAVLSKSLAHTHTLTATGSVGYNGSSGQASKPATIGVMWIVRFV